jgi:site-specific recombinase XerD
MSVLFNHAIRQEWLEQGRNPILLVRQSAKRQRIPAWLEPEELRALLLHSFSTMLIANGENVKVVQELMRHSNCRCTLEIYSQARLQAKRDAQHRVIEMIVPQGREATVAKESLAPGNNQDSGAGLP